MSSWIGRDIKPRIGTRVQLDPRIGNRGIGTIVGMPADALTCSVQWDTGVREDNLAIGDNAQFYLIEAAATITERKSTSLVSQPRRNTRSLSPSPARQCESGWAGERMAATQNRSYYVGRPQGQSTDWQEEARSHGVRASNDSFATLTRTPSKPNASITNAMTTIGLSVYGTQVDHLLPRGPAHLSQQLDKGDEILEVDGQPVNQDNIAQAIVGSDLVNTTVKLTVRKATADNAVVQVEVMRVAKRSVESTVELFELLTQLKQNGHNVEDFERSTYPPGSASTVELTDRVTEWISNFQIDKYNADLRTRNQFQQLYSELRTHLSDAYLEIDKLEAQQRGTGSTPKNAGTAQVDKLAAELASSEKELQHTKLALQEARKSTTLTQSRSASSPAVTNNDFGDPAELKAELEEKKQQLAKEIEAGMQKDFDIKKLQGEAELMRKQCNQLVRELEAAKRYPATPQKSDQGEVELLRKQCNQLVEELEAAKRELVVSEQEMLRIRKEDAILEEKITQLQEHLDDNAGDEAALERLQTQLQQQVALQEEELEQTYQKKMAELLANNKAGADDLRKQLEESRRDLLASERRANASEDKLRALQEELVGLSDQLKEDRNKREAEMVRLQQEARKARYRSGDVLDILVESVSGLKPGTGEAEVYVMLNIDDKHQVQQTTRQPAADTSAQLNQSFVAELFETSKSLVISAYSCQPKQAGELLGSSRMLITEVPFGTEKEVELVLETEETEGEGKTEEVVTRLRLTKANASARAAWAHLGTRTQTPPRERTAAPPPRDAGKEGEMLKEIDMYRKQIVGLEEDRKAEAQACERERLRADRLQREVDALQREVQIVREKQRESEERLNSELAKTSGREAQILQLQQQIVAFHKQRDQDVLGEKASREEALKREREDARRELAEEVRAETRMKLKDEVREEAKREAREEMRVEITKQITSEHERKAKEKQFQGLKELQGDMKQLAAELAEAKQKHEQAEKALKEETEVKEQFEAEIHNLLRQIQEQSREAAALRTLNESLQDDRERLEPITNQSVLSPPTPGFAAYNKQRGVTPPLSTANLTPPPHSEGQPSASSPPPGVVGVSIANNPPYTVVSISELMDEYGNTINDRVRLGDELLDVNGVRALDIAPGQLAQRIAGPAGTTVTLRFLDPGTTRVFSITALRHLPFNSRSPTMPSNLGPTNLNLTSSYNSVHSQRPPSREGITLLS